MLENDLVIASDRSGKVGERCVFVEFCGVTHYLQSSVGPDGTGLVARAVAARTVVIKKLAGALAGVGLFHSAASILVRCWRSLRMLRFVMRGSRLFAGSR
jgi:hypothetical protein